MVAVVAVVACLALVVVSELARYLVARMLGVPVVRVAKVFVDLRGGRRWARVVAIAAGTVVTYLGVVALALALYRADGVPKSDYEVIVENVVEGYPAYGKLEAGDRIVAIDGGPLTKSLSSLVDQRNGSPVRLTFYRNGTTRDVTLAPIGHDGHWLLGFHPSMVHARDHHFGLALSRAFAFPIVRTRELLPMPHEAADPGGPKRIVDVYHAPAPTLTVRMLGEAARFAVYILLLVVVIDLVRAVRAVTAPPRVLQS